MNKFLKGAIIVSGFAVAAGASAAPWVAREATVPIKDGMVKIALVKNGTAERTLVCRDTADALVKIRPEGVAFDTAKRGGKKVVTEEVIEEERFIPVAVSSCTVSKGDNFDKAMTKARSA